MPKLKVKMLKGGHQDIVDSNIRSLKDAGYSHAHATHLSLKHARKGSAKKQKSIVAKIVKQNPQVDIKG